MKYKTVVCPLCQKAIEVRPSATVQHLACPKKKPRSHPPIYVEVKP